MSIKDLSARARLLKLETCANKIVPYQTDSIVLCTIRIHHECEGGIEKSVPRINVWDHKVCRVMTNSDYEGQAL